MGVHMNLQTSSHKGFMKRQSLVIAREEVWEKIAKQAEKDKRPIPFTIGYLLEKATKIYDGSTYLTPEEYEEEK